MYKIAVMGSPDTIMGFRALGLEAIPIHDEEEACGIFRKLTRQQGADEYAIIYVEECFAQCLSEDIAKFKDRPTPAVILIPGKEGSMGLGLSALQSAVERAVGANIL